MDHGNARREPRIKDQKTSVVNRSRILFVILGILLFLVGFVAGRVITMQQMMATTDAETVRSEPVLLPEAAEMPERDVTGHDIEDLPRYPGAVRVEYRHVVLGELVETEVEYVVAAALTDVHDYYRRVFDEEGWTVADLGIYQGEWTFLVVSGEREAIVELEARQSLVEIEIELTEPASPVP